MFIATDFFDAGFWDRVHSGGTHLPIALALTSTLLDGVGSIVPSVRFRERFRFSGYFTLLLAAFGAVPAVISGLILTRRTVHRRFLVGGAIVFGIASRKADFRPRREARLTTLALGRRDSLYCSSD
jgi:hypothetical protein